MGRSSRTISIEDARKLIASHKLTRTSWSTELRAGQKPVSAEVFDDGGVTLYYTDRYPHLFAEYEKL